MRFIWSLGGVIIAGMLALSLNLPGQSAIPPTPALVWDKDVNEYKAKEGETNVFLYFHVTNQSPAEILIQRVDVSCGCTTPQLPSLPWRIAAGDHDKLKIAVDLRGKMGILTKAILVHSSAGPKTLMVKVHVPHSPQTTMVQSDRARNMLTALNDNKAIFKGECARCHAQSGAGKHGAELYAAVCGICHDSPHRATVVPDLKALPHPTNHDYWLTSIRHGKVGTMMPGFAKSEEGPLTDEQINSLADFLSKAIPATPPPGKPIIITPRTPVSR
ncbi:MAG: DUF1573 domain-containing protein [Verrucomicrobiota bacterium]